MRDTGPIKGEHPHGRLKRVAFGGPGVGPEEPGDGLDGPSMKLCRKSVARMCLALPPLFSVTGGKPE